MAKHTDIDPANLVFGPVPSRRLGRSLGVNNIPPKVCSYSCVYCQVGLTTDEAIERRRFFGTDAIVRAVEGALRAAAERGEAVDHLSFVPDGEPTLDIDLGATIEALAPTGVPVAVITNASLLWREDVRRELAGAARVSVKVDAVDEAPWRRVNRPYGTLSLEQVLAGIRAFADEYDGVLTTETMLVDGVNDQPDTIANVAAFVAELDPAAAYVAAPTRPPAESWATPPGERTLYAAWKAFAERVGRVEFLAGPRAPEFASLGDAAQDLVAICAVEPMEHDAAVALLDAGGEGPELLEELVADGLVRRLEHAGTTFYALPDQRRTGG